MKLFIVTPNDRPVSPMHSISMLGLIVTLKGNGMALGYECRVNSENKPSSRHGLLRFAIEKDFTHALMVNDDMYFAPEAGLALVKRFSGGEKPVFVATNYVTKPGGAPQRPMACDMQGNTLRSKGKTGTEEVGDIGLGFCMINLEFLKRVPLPWFEIPWVGDEKDGDNFIEDTYFCATLRKAGATLLVDHHASGFVGRIGEKVYTEADLVEDKPSKSKLLKSGDTK